MNKLPFKKLSELTKEEIENLDYPVTLFDVSKEDSEYFSDYYNDDQSVSTFKGFNHLNSLNKEQLLDSISKNDYLDSVVIPDSRLIVYFYYSVKSDRDDKFVTSKFNFSNNRYETIKQYDNFVIVDGKEVKYNFMGRTKHCFGMVDDAVLVHIGAPKCKIISKEKNNDIKQMIKILRNQEQFLAVEDSLSHLVENMPDIKFKPKQNNNNFSKASETTIQELKDLIEKTRELKDKINPLTKKDEPKP